MDFQVIQRILVGKILAYPANKCDWTPFDGYEVKGFPLGTIVNGKAIVWDGKLIEKANGKPLKF